MVEMANKFLERPPTYTTVFDINWVKWFDTVHYRLSTRNHQTITQADSIDVDARYVDVSTSSATYAVTLAAPTIPGVFKTIEMSARTGSYDVTLALTNCVGGSASSTCTFNTAGGALHMISLSNKWLILNEYNVTLS